MQAKKYVNIPFLLICILLPSIFVVAQVHRPGDFRPNPVSLGVKAGDPFDVGTGIFYREYADLVVDDSIPINFVRTQRNLDPQSRSFGIGGSTSYDLFIVGDVDRFSWVSLVEADGAEIRYTRISPGHSYYNGVFEDQATPGKFLGSRISWNWWHADWNIAMKDGSNLTVQGCNAKSKPGQCAVTEIKDKAGDRLVVERDPDGNIVRIKSPHGHVVSVTNDSAGRITRIEDDANHWAAYMYNAEGGLVRAQNWRGDSQDFFYDAQWNMTRIQELGSGETGLYSWSINNTFDEQNRFKAQALSSGEVIAVRYFTDSKNNVVQTDVRGSEGLSQYFFNELGYETRQEFQPTKGPGWIYQQVRDPKSNAATEAFLQCGSVKVALPLEVEIPLGENGEAQIAYLSAACKRAENSIPHHGKSVSPRTL